MASFEEFLETYQPPAQMGRALAQSNEFAKPEEAATALSTARKAGLPPEVTDLDPLGFKQRQQQESNARILSFNDGLSSFIAENPVAGKAINDDYEKLDAFSKTLNAVKTGWHRGVIGEKLGFVGWQVSAGLGGEEQVPELERRIEEHPEVKDGALHYVQAFSGMLGQMFVDASIAAGGAGVGAAGGALFGGVGAIPGAALGGTAGFASAMAAASGGRTFLESGKLRDENGQPLPLAHRQAASALVGVAAGALGMLGVRSNAAEIAAPIIRDATLEAMKNSTFRDALTKGAGELARGGVTGAAMMGTLTAIQEGVLDAAKGLSDGDWKTIGNDPKRRQEVVSAINRSMLEGALLVGGLHAPAVGFNFVADAARIRRSQADLKSLDNLIDAAGETNTATRSPEALAAFVRHSVGEQVIGFPAETIDRFLAAKPGSLDFIPDLAKQLEQSHTTGSDIVAPLADFLAHNPEMLKALREDVRLRPDGLTAKEATELEESPPDYAAIAFHGSPHVFDAFDISKIGTGEGAQSYGHGLYFAEAPGVAKSYQEGLTAARVVLNDQTFLDTASAVASLGLKNVGTFPTRYPAQFILDEMRRGKTLEEAVTHTKEEYAHYPKEAVDAAIKAIQDAKIEPRGALYQVRLKLDPERTILYDRPMAEQPQIIKDFFAKEGFTEGRLDQIMSDYPRKIEAEIESSWKPGGPDLWESAKIEASKRLREAGIQGIKYLDQDSRSHALDRPRDLEMIEENKTALAKERELLQEAIEQGDEGGRRINEELIKALEHRNALIQKRLDAKVTHNFVVLDDKLIEITHRNGEPLLKQAVVEASTRERRANWLDPLLRPEGDGKPPLGMTEAEYALYSQKLERLAAATERRAEALATKEVSRRETETWKRNLAEITDETRTDLRYDPRILVDTYLRDRRIGDVEVPRSTWLRLDREAVETILGEKEQLPKGATVAKGGVHPDVLADMFGYGSGQKMLEDLMALHRERQLLGLTPARHFERMVSEEAARRMEERHGRLDENIAREAQEMVVQQAQTEVLGAELEFLTSKRGGGDLPLDRQSLEAATHELFEDMPLVRAKDFQGAMRTVARMGRAAEMALLKGDIDAAFQAKQRQWQAHIIAQGAKQLEKDFARFEKLTQRFSEKVIHSVEQPYTDRIHQVMALYEIPSKRNLAELQSAIGKETIGDWSKRVSQESGQPVYVPEFMTDPTFWRKGDPAQGFLPLDELPTKAFHWVRDALQNIEHVGRREKELNLQQEKIKLDEAIAEGVGFLNTRNTVMQPLDPVYFDKVKMIGREWDAALQRPEQLAQDLSRHDPTGIFIKLFQSISKSKYSYDKMLREVGAELEKQPGSEKFQKSLTNRIVNEELRDWQTGKLLQLDGQHLLGIMYHMGNESNFRKLTSKFEWLGQEVGWDAEAVQRLVQRNATKEHWDVVQHVWSISENYFWPKVEEMYRRVSGVAPDKIEGEPFFAFGERYSGGYAPIVKDPRWINAGQDERGLFNETNGGTSALPPKGYSLSRTEANYPVSYDFRSVISAFRQTMHDLSYRESLIEANKFFNQRPIREGIVDKYGMEYYKEIKPWLEYIANARLIDEATVQGADRYARGARNALVTTELVGRASTIGAHSMAALFNSVGEIGRLYGSEGAVGQITGPIRFVGEFLKQWSSPIGWRLATEAQARSGELTTRMHQMDRDLRAMGERILLGESSLRDRLTYGLGKPFMWLDQASAIPVYTLAERFYLTKGFSREEASTMADTVVRNAHGSTGITDMAPILRSSETMKALTVAYGTFNHSYNRLRTMTTDFADIRRTASDANVATAFGKFFSGAMMAAWYIGLIGVAEHWLKHSGPDHDKEESWLAWGLKSMLRQTSATLPLGRDLGQAVINKLEGKPMFTSVGGPHAQMVETATKLLGHGINAINPDKEVGGTWWLDFAKGTGYALRIPGAGQLGVSGQFQIDLNHGWQDAESIPEYMRGYLLGKSDPHRRIQRR